MSLYFAKGKKGLLFYLSPYLPLSTSVERGTGGRGLQNVNSLSV